jgi:hypothetical protein
MSNEYYKELYYKDPDRQYQEDLKGVYEIDGNEFVPIQQVMKETNRTISLSDAEADELVTMIQEAKRFIARRMAHSYYLDIEFLNSLRGFVEYDKHVSYRQMKAFWNIYDQLPEKIKSGLL